MARRRTIATGAALLIALVALWLFPIVFFPHPGANDAIWLANLEFLLILLGWIGLAAAVFLSRARRGFVGVELGVYAIASAATMPLGLAVFGNFSNDRYLPLIFLPPLVGVPGLLALLVGLAVLKERRQRLTAAAYGIAGAVLIEAWILVRGARDWLLAPYGFDEVAVILVIGAALLSVRQLTRG